jgi:hypothetical protein
VTTVGIPRDGDVDISEVVLLAPRMISESSAMGEAVGRSSRNRLLDAMPHTDAIVVFGGHFDEEAVSSAPLDRRLIACGTLFPVRDRFIAGRESG